MRIAICDDCRRDALSLEKYLEGHEVSIYSDGESLLSKSVHQCGVCPLRREISGNRRRLQARHTDWRGRAALYGAVPDIVKRSGKCLQCPKGLGGGAADTDMFCYTANGMFILDVLVATDTFPGTVRMEVKTG